MMSGSSCSICLDCFSRPVACIPCGHVFCGNCIRQWRNSGQNCPHCRECIRDTQRIIWEDSDIYQDCSQKGQGQLFDATWLREKLEDFREKSVKEIQTLSSRVRNICYRETVHQILDSVRKSWEDVGLETQVLIGFVFVLVVSLLIQDVNSEHGVVRTCLLPVFELIFDAACRVSSLLLFTLTRPVLCLGRCLCEICCMFSDIFIGLVHTLINVTTDAIMVPVVIMRSIAVGIVLLINFSAQIVLTLLRLLFMAVLCCVIVFAIRPDPTVTSYVNRGVELLADCWNRFKSQHTEVQQREVQEREES